MMLTNSSAGIFDAYLSSGASAKDLSSTTSAQDPFADGIPATMGLNGGSGYGYQTPAITSLGSSAGTTIVPGPVRMTNTLIDYNSYQEWGEWTQTTPMIAGATEYTFNNKGYWIAGDVTPNRPTAGSYAYSGTARGTHYSASGGTNMSGTFNCNVNFGAGSNQISGFNVDVSGGGKSASITGATGTFTSGSNFTVTGGAAAISGSTGGAPSHKTYGAMYGSSAQAIGGVWSIDGTGTKAVGVFQGKK